MIVGELWYEYYIVILYIWFVFVIIVFYDIVFSEFIWRKVEI